MNNDHIFKRMMDYIIEDNFKQARLSILSDVYKVDNSSLSSAIIMSSKDNKELIKNAAGFSFMSQKIQSYYYNPEKALDDYKQ